MATITATKSGNWSDTTVWDLGRAPVDGDLVQAVSYVIDFDVDINQPSTVLNATSGYFRYNGGATRNVTANANLGTHSTAGLIQNSAVGTLNFYGIVVGGSGSNAHGAINNAAGMMTVTTATGGSESYANGAVNNAAGTMTVTTATGGSGSNAHGAVNNAAGMMTVTTATGGSGSSAYGVFNNAAGTMTVTTATGGSGSSAYGVFNNGGTIGDITGDLTAGNANGAWAVYNGGGTIGDITGDLTAGNASGAWAVYNDGGGTIGDITGDLTAGNANSACAVYNDGGTIGDITGDLTAGDANGAWAVYNDGTIGDIDGSLICGATGQFPIFGPFRLVANPANNVTFCQPNGNPWTLSNDYPAPADVRSGVEYDRGTQTGEMAAGGSIGPVSIVIGGGGIRIS